MYIVALKHSMICKGVMCQLCIVAYILVDDKN